MLMLLLFSRLPLYSSGRDWLIYPEDYPAKIISHDDSQTIELNNGILRRLIKLQPNAATISLQHLQTGEEFIRSIRPEAEIRLDSLWFAIGGLTGQPIHNYFRSDWLDQMQGEPAAFQYVDYDTGQIQARFAWKKRLEWLPVDLPWPPPGKMLTLKFKANTAAVRSLLSGPGAEEKRQSISAGRFQLLLDQLSRLTMQVHYEIYDGIPLLSKWITLENGSQQPVTLNQFKSEILALVEAESAVGNQVSWLLPNLTIETDYAFGGSMSAESCLGKSVFWQSDPLYLTQVNYERQTPCLLECRPQVGPEIRIQPGQGFASFRTFELVHDARDRERQGLAQRRMYRTIAPWVTENPILMHVRQADPAAVKLAIDQCAKVGFEMVIMTFGSGFNIEDESTENIARIRALADYAHGQGIALGGYSLLASRTVGGGDDVVMPEGRQPTFGNSPCLESHWGHDYFRKLYQFFEKTGLDVLEHDGSYPGDVCAAGHHPGHTGLGDSQWRQFARIRDFYRWCRGQGIYLNVPDWYFLNGSTKTGMGYRETNWSLPRAQQEIIERQNIFDGTWEKTPSMGWMFVPLTEYHGGGAAATIEPLKDHLQHYGQRLANLFGAGVQACYRGPRLYDSPETKAVVQKWLDFYLKHRAILDSDLIHLRRPDGQRLDGILHVNPELKTKGLALFYNPTDPIRTEMLSLPLYYTGLSETATVKFPDGKVQTCQLDRHYNIQVTISVPGQDLTWLVIE